MLLEDEYINPNDISIRFYLFKKSDWEAYVIRDNNQKKNVVMFSGNIKACQKELIGIKSLIEDISTLDL